MTRTIRLGSVLFGATLGLGLTPVNAPAQDATDDLVLEEVTVTAQRREESLQDVPISISAYSHEDLERTRIGSAADYLVKTPNVGFSEDGEGGSRSINVSIRGVSNITLDGVATANSIGYYIDELSVGAVAQGTVNPQLQDMERIEVLRGPQGTYYGRNAVGGAINITTVKPGPEQYFEGTVKIGSFDTYGAEAIFNVPFSDTFMARGVFAYEESDTPIENVNPLGNDPFYEYLTGRLSFRILPSDDVTIDLSITRTDEDEGGDIAVPSGVVDLDTGSIFGLGPHDAIDSGQGFYPDTDDRIDRDTIERNDKSFTIINGRVAWDLGKATLKSVTGYIDSSFDREADLDGIPFTFGPLPLRRVNDYGGTSWSQELRLMSSDDSKYSWTLGAFYVDDDLDRINQIQIMPDDAPSGDPEGFINSDQMNFRFKSAALFGEATMPFNDSIDVTIGARWSRDKVTTSMIDFNLGPEKVSGSKTFEDFSPRVVVRHMTDVSTFYGSVSKGYKAGGVDVASQQQLFPLPFESEDLWSYELGFKTQFAGGRANLSAAVFYNDWSDFQVQTNRLADPNDISSGVSATQNAEEASSRGAEIEFTALLAEELIWAVNLGYIDSEFDDYRDAVLRGQTNGNDNIIDVSGQPLPRSPEWTANTWLQYDFDLGNWASFVRAEVTYTDDQYSDIEAIGSLVGETVFGDPFNLPAFPYQIDSYTLVNLYAGMETDRFRIRAYAKNLLDEQYYNGTADNFGAAGIRLRPHFRELGVSFTIMSR
ncbi:TonB-dependent receptor [Elongatibacter sediminis]|uniref:TonB-dependent receptor n=1 Tax=Elongatibacter sediminis TaxID=3119006 RepID=A0AAW9RF70_9GAMM